MKASALLLILLPVLASAEMYRWVDKDGLVHYTQTPPAGFDAKAIAPAPPPSANPGVESIRKFDQSAVKAAGDSAKKQDDAERLRVEQEAACKQAQERIAFLETRAPYRVAKKDEEGNISRMTPEDYDKSLGIAHEVASKNCH